MEERFKIIRVLVDAHGLAALTVGATSHRQDDYIDKCQTADKVLEELLSQLEQLELDVADHLGREAHYRERFSVTALALADLAEAVLDSSWDGETKDLARDCLWRVLLNKDSQE